MKIYSRHYRVVLLVMLTFFVPALGQTVTKTSAVVAPIDLRVTPEPSVISLCSAPETNRVHLTAAANSPDGHPLKYRWTTPAGTIIGEGPNVLWDVSGLAPGYYKASVNASTGVESCEAFSSTNVLVNPCAPAPLVCPQVAIECPQSVLPGQPLSFSTKLSGGSTNVTPIYNWVVSGGQIVSGQGTNSIAVDTTGLAGQMITATISVGGYNLDCAATCSIAIPVPVAPSRKFDEFPDLARNDEKARLDNFAVELQNDPTSTAYVIIYPSRRGGSAEVQRRSARIVDYLVNSRRIDASKIVTLVGPSRDKLMIELWVTPQGSTPPKP